MCPPHLFTSSQSSPHVLIRNSGLTQMVSEEERKNHSFTVKVFLSQWDDRLLKRAVERSELYNFCTFISSRHCPITSWMHLRYQLAGTAPSLAGCISDTS